MSKYIKKDENGFYVFDEIEFLKTLPNGLEYFAVDEETEQIYNLGFNYKEKMEKQITDLEAKLAEMEQENRDLHTSINLSIPNQIAMRDEIERLHTCIDDRIAELVKENAELKQQLAEKDNTITNLIEDSTASKELLNQQLEEKEKEIEKLKQRLKDTIKIYSDDFVEKDKELKELRFQARNIFPLVENLEDKVNKDKISFAVEKLEKVRSFAYNTFKEFGCFDETDLEHILDNQIEELKKGENK